MFRYGLAVRGTLRWAEMFRHKIVQLVGLTAAVAIEGTVPPFERRQGRLACEAWESVDMVVLLCIAIDEVVLVVGYIKHTWRPSGVHHRPHTYDVCPAGRILTQMATPLSLNAVPGRVA